MLCNARIRDSKRVGKKNKKPEPRRRGWMVKIDEISKRKPAPKLWSPQMSPFSQLTLAGRHAELNPLFSASPKLPALHLRPFSSHSSPDDSLDSLTAEINSCSLHDSAGEPAVATAHGLVLRSAQRKNEEISSPPARSSRARESAERWEERNLKELNPEDSRGAVVNRLMLTPGQQTLPTASTPLHCPRVLSPLLHYLSPAHSLPLSPRQKVLALCEQTQPLLLSNFFSDKMVESLSKLGEGTFAEVFGCQTEMGETLAIKIIPIEGSLPYNDEPQSTYQDVLTEMVITKELSQLGEQSAKENRHAALFTENFLQVKRLALCKGQYPDFLLDSWDSYDHKHRSENDRPDMFPRDQLYVLLAAQNAGASLDDYEFASVEEGLSIISQVVGALAVGEAALELEHRDLHRANVLVSKTEQKQFYYRLEGREFIVPSHGVKATIVDYTLSRIKQDDCVSFNDLERLPWLFEGEGDIQFNVYRDMRKATDSKWDQFTPYTNILWLNFLLAKLTQSTQIYSSAVSTRSWRASFRPLHRNISNFSSAQEAFVESDLFLSMS